MGWGGGGGREAIGNKSNSILLEGPGRLLTTGATGLEVPETLLTTGAA